ncbi:MAG: hypothetical protein QOH08_1307 [Chloroflexota bacterium]|jgi:hypothetical protein|nr:hypothetical protein [Chloroflexota bacterium]
MLWSKRDDRRFIDDGRVGCAVRGTDVELDECLGCAKLRRVVEHDPPFIVCTARPDISPIAELAL